MLSKLTSFLDKKEINYKHQLGFKKNKFSILAVLELNARIAKALGNGHYAASVFLDFAEAFDIVNHQILVPKVLNYGIRGQDKTWFESYLRNRQQAVKIVTTLSDKMQITCGVSK